MTPQNCFDKFLMHDQAILSTLSHAYLFLKQKHIINYFKSPIWPPSRPGVPKFIIDPSLVGPWWCSSSFHFLSILPRQDKLTGWLKRQMMKHSSSIFKIKSWMSCPLFYKIIKIKNNHVKNKYYFCLKLCEDFFIYML